jgi:hypothetical protein
MTQTVRHPRRQSRSGQRSFAKPFSYIPDLHCTPKCQFDGPQICFAFPLNGRKSERRVGFPWRVEVERESPAARRGESVQKIKLRLVPPAIFPSTSWCSASPTSGA